MCKLAEVQGKILYWNLDFWLIWYNLILEKTKLRFSLFYETYAVSPYFPKFYYTRILFWHHTKIRTDWGFPNSTCSWTLYFSKHKFYFCLVCFFCSLPWDLFLNISKIDVKEKKKREDMSFISKVCTLFLSSASSC